MALDVLKLYLVLHGCCLPWRFPIKNQSPVVSGNLSSDRNVSSLPRRKRNLNVQVPKRQFHNDDDFSHAPNSSENYPNLSPRRHPRNGESHSESPCNWPNYGKQQSFPLPLPPKSTSNSPPPFSHSSSAATSSLPRSPGRMESDISSGSHWKKGELIGGGEYGHLYLGFNRWGNVNHVQLSILFWANVFSNAIWLYMN